MDSLGFPPLTLAIFAGVVLACLVLDLVARRDDKPVTLKSASLWSLFWVAVSLAFAGYLHIAHGSETASLFLTGYALEKVLSVDNLFVFMAIFAWFKIPDGLRHRVLYWGILGAILFRLVFVAIGTGLLAFGPWIEILFGLVVAATAVMMLRAGDEDDEPDYSNHLAYNVALRLFPVLPNLVGNKFFARPDYVEGEDTHRVITRGRLHVTPLFLALLVVETSDVLFAFDSVPAVIAVSREPLIVYSAMLFAILGLRSLYFVLEALKRYLVHLEKAIVLLLFFISGKLILSATDHLWHHGYTISPESSLLVVLLTLVIGIAASVAFPGKQDGNSPSVSDTGTAPVPNQQP